MIATTTSAMIFLMVFSRDRSATPAAAIRRGEAERAQHAMPRRCEAEQAYCRDDNNDKSD
jgi:hypothetical protein